MLRKYHLDSEDRRGGTTTWYALVFDEQGKMLVELTTDYDQPYKKDHTGFISPDSFEKHQINGKPLSQLVAEKLDAILPPSN